MLKFCVLLFLVSLNFKAQALVVGAQQIESYSELLRDKRIGLVVNQTSKVDGLHLIDFFIQHKFNVKKLFALEHGLRGDLDAGEEVRSGIDVATGLPVISLYGAQKAPSLNDLNEIDVLIFDIQDIGVRFYTYISSLYYILESCGKYQKHCVIFDRPSPMANRVEGPVLDMRWKSFVGMYPIPVIHGLTVGELSLMVKGEKWIRPDFKLTVIPVKDWKRHEGYILPIKPSPNLPNQNSIEWYPSLALFEATVMSVGRGTYFPFEVIGYPRSDIGEFTFTPVSIPTMSKNPPHQNALCYGEDLRDQRLDKFTLYYVIKYFKLYGKKSFFSAPDFFHKLIGNSQILPAIMARKSLEDIEQSWQTELNQYKKQRQKYLIYE